MSRRWWWRRRPKPHTPRASDDATGEEEPLPGTGGDDGTPSPRPSHATQSPEEAAEQAARETERLVEQESTGTQQSSVTRPGAPFDRRSPFYIGFMAALGVLIAYGLVQVVLELSQIITFIVVALFLALGLEPIVARLTTYGVRRGWAVLVVVVGVAAVFGLLGWLIVPTIVAQTTDLVRQTPDYLEGLRQNSVVEELNRRWHVTARIQQNLADSINQGTVGSIFGGVVGAGKAFVEGVVAAFTVLVLTLYFLAAMPRAKAAAYELVPRSRRPRVVYLSEEISRRVGGYVLGQLVVATVNGLFSYVIVVVLDLPFPAVLATIVGLLALVPIVGTLIGGVLITLVALSSGWATAVIVLGYYVAYHVFEAYVLAPRVMRRAVEVPPVVTIVAILAGGALLGIIGALIAIPVAAGLLLIYEQVLVPRQQRS